MTTPVIKTSFAAGELTPHLWGHPDLQKYAAGVKTARNFFVDHRGGMTSRAGSAFINAARAQTGKPRFIRFKFSSNQSYVLVLDANLGMQIIADGAMVTETPINISGGSNANPLVLIASSGTWAAGDMVFVSGVTGLARTNGVSGVNSRTFRVGSVASTTHLSLQDYWFSDVNASGWTAYTSGGTVARILTVAMPWAAADLFDLKFAQSADVLTVTHPSYATFEIKRLSATDWTITPAAFGTAMAAPANTAAAAVNNPGGSSQQFFYAYAVTAVDDDTGDEGYYGAATCTCVNAALDQNKGVTNKITWNPVSNATSYKIYKAQPVPNGSEDSGPYFYGLMGTSKSNSFQDVNYSADFTTAPPTPTNPFSSGSFASVTMQTTGFGFITPQATVYDVTGSGAVLVPNINAAGAVTSTTVGAAGDNYSAPHIVYTETATTPGVGLTLAFSGSWVASGGGFVPAPGSITINTAGTHYHVPNIAIAVNGAAAGTFQNGTAYCTTSGAVPNSVVILSNPFVLSTAGVTLSFTITDKMAEVGTPGSAPVAIPVLANTNFPGVVGFFDQRRVFGGSNVNPDTLWASRPGLYSNMNVSFPSQADDAITATIVGQEVNQIESLTAMSSGLIILTSDGAWQFAASGSSATVPQALTPSSASAGAQAFSGSSSLQPLRVNYDLIFEMARGGAVRGFTYNFYVNVYTGQDISALSQHLLEGHRLAQWAYAEAPNYLIWAVRDDGIMLTLAYLKEQELVGWTRHDTNGSFVSVESIPEGDEDAVYVAVLRQLPKGDLYTLERMHSQTLGADLAANIPSNPEDAWCLDAAVEYPLTTPDDVLRVGSWQPPGQIDANTASVDAGGQGYPNTVPVTITDLLGNGQGATASCTASGGAITSFVITSPGQNYVQPQFTLGGGGTGGAVSARVMNLMEFVPGNAATLNNISAGDVLRVRGGRGNVHSFTSNSMLVDMTRPLYGMQFNSTAAVAMATVASGNWSCTTPVSVVGGLDHLEGQTVGVVVDGNVQNVAVVSDGCVTLERPGTRIRIGLLYSCQLGTLDFDAGEPTVQGRRKQIPAVTIRGMDTRGILIGTDWNSLVEEKERTTEAFGEPIEFMTGGEFMTQSIGVGNPT